MKVAHNRHSSKKASTAYFPRRSLSALSSPCPAGLTPEKLTGLLALSGTCSTQTNSQPSYRSRIGFRFPFLGWHASATSPKQRIEVYIGSVYSCFDAAIHTLSQPTNVPCLNHSMLRLWMAQAWNLPQPDPLSLFFPSSSLPNTLLLCWEGEDQSII